MSAGSAQLPATRLRALIERSSAAGARQPEAPPTAVQQEHCGLCGLPIPEHHRHVLDLVKRELHCACQACSVLFDHSAAGGGHYRLVPDRCAPLRDFRVDELGWHALGIPVEMVFFVRDAERNRMRAFYPSAAGAIESELALEAWEYIEEANPALRELEPEVEALLVNRTNASTRAYIVGLDQCYRLVAVVRQHWRGFSGGDRVWQEIERFFGALESRAGARA